MYNNKRFSRRGRRTRTGLSYIGLGRYKTIGLGSMAWSKDVSKGILKVTAAKV